MYVLFIPVQHLHHANKHQLLAMVAWGISLRIESTTGGRHIQFISLANIQQALHYYFVAGFVGPYANLLIKASVCAMILRIMQGRAWRIGLWSLLATFVLFFIAITVTNTLECSPVSAFWNIAERYEKCWPSSTVAIIANVLGGTLHFSPNFIGDTNNHSIYRLYGFRSGAPTVRSRINSSCESSS
jgi:hypothetical protein